MKWVPPTFPPTKTSALDGRYWTLVEQNTAGAQVNTGLEKSRVKFRRAHEVLGGALAIGLLCGVFCYLSVTVLKRRFGYDDSLDVFGLHGIGGMIGAVLTGVFCVPSLGGLVEGVTMGAQVVAQIKGVLLTTVYCFAVSWIILKVINAVIGLRADESVEEMGLDLAEHNESAYNH